MRFRSRVFLLSSLPLTLLLGASFLGVQALVQTIVHDGLQTTLRDNQISMRRLRLRSNTENSRFLKVAGENASLKAGVQLLLSDPGDPAARATVDDQLTELCERMGFDFLIVSNTNGAPIAGVFRSGSGTAAHIAAFTGPIPPLQGRVLQTIDNRIYQIAAAPIDQGEENMGILSVGELFDLEQFGTPTILLQHGRVIRSNIPGLDAATLSPAMKQCAGKPQCDVQVAGAAYLSLPLEDIALGDGYELRSFQNIDVATAPVRKMLHKVFLIAGFIAFGIALVFSVVASRAVVTPVMTIISHLRRSESTGLLTEFEQDPSAVQELQELTASFNRAANAIRDGRNMLQGAYLEFVGSLANALDARDPYTAGHSHRVSVLACDLATELGVPDGDVDQIRVGALLHDIGKIGISDTVLRKPGRLTEAEFDLIKAHPRIGRRILEGVHGFSPYLAAVELHHENWDGSGYPHGQRAEETPLVARIIHVADAYDAMTTDRPYRRGMTKCQALAILNDEAGRQFDPGVIAAINQLTGRPAVDQPDHQLQEAL